MRTGYFVIIALSAAAGTAAAQTPGRITFPAVGQPAAMPVGRPVTELAPFAALSAPVVPRGRVIDTTGPNVVAPTPYLVNQQQRGIIDRLYDALAAIVPFRSGPTPFSDTGYFPSLSRRAVERNRAAVAPGG